MSRTGDCGRNGKAVRAERAVTSGTDEARATSLYEMITLFFVV